MEVGVKLIFTGIFQGKIDFRGIQTVRNNPEIFETCQYWWPNRFAGIFESENAEGIIGRILDIADTKIAGGIPSLLELSILMRPQRIV